MNWFLPALGAGILIITTLAFWAAMQNWIASLIDKARLQLGQYTELAQSALVVLDRAIVNGQRIVIATGRVLFDTKDQPTVVQEVREMDPQALPTDVLARLDAASKPLTYELSIGKGQSKPRVTRRLEVKRED